MVTNLVPGPRALGMRVSPERAHVPARHHLDISVLHVPTQVPLFVFCLVQSVCSTSTPTNSNCLLASPTHSMICRTFGTHPFLPLRLRAAGSPMRRLPIRCRQKQILSDPLLGPAGHAAGRLHPKYGRTYRVRCIPRGVHSNLLAAICECHSCRMCWPIRTINSRRRSRRCRSSRRSCHATPRGGMADLPPEGSVIVEPSTLIFESNGPTDNPFKSPIPATLEIMNKNSEGVC